MLEDHWFCHQIQFNGTIAPEPKKDDCELNELNKNFQDVEDVVVVD